MFLPLTTSTRLARRPWLTGVAISACVALFVRAAAFQAGLGSRSPMSALALTSLAQPSRLFTYAFAHAGWGHLLGNMFFLWTFGRLLEARWGRLATAVCFATCSAAGGVVHLLAHRGGDTALVGASGAIAGLAGAVVVALPNARFDRLMSPLFWPVTPILALLRGRGWAASLELLPIYGWILRLRRGLPAFFVLPAWLSFDLFAMVVFPDHRTSYACHVGGALAGIVFAIAMRVSKLPEFVEPPDATDDGTSTLAPAVRLRRAAERPSQWPEGRLSGLWFVLSLALAVGLSVATSRLTETARAYSDKRELEAYRKRLAETAPLGALDRHFDHELLSTSYPAAFARCIAGAQGSGCSGHASPDTADAVILELVRPEALETVYIAGLRHAIDKRAELATMVANELTRSGDAKESTAWRLLEARNGACRGAFSIESVIQIGEGTSALRMWSCTFTEGMDLYFFAYLVPEVLRERDEAVLQAMFAATTTPVAVEKQLISAASGAPAAVPPPKAPPPGGRVADDDDPTECAEGETAYRVDGKLRCHRSESGPSVVGVVALPRAAPSPRATPIPRRRPQPRR